MPDATQASDELLADAWSAGAYEKQAAHYLSMAGRLVDGAPINTGTSVLDIGCGTGSVAIAAARAGGEVTGIDITPELLDQAQENAEVGGCPGIRWEVADVTAMPVPVDEYAVTLSNLGHMYGQPPADTTDELLRVTAPGGHIGFTAWTPSSIYPTMAQTFLPYLAEEALPDIPNPPFLWGEPSVVSDRLKPAARDLHFDTATAEYPVMSPRHFLEETFCLSGLFTELMSRVEETERPALRTDLLEVVHQAFAPDRGAVELEYLLTTARLRG